MTELYWITRLGALQGVFIAIAILTGIAVIVGTIMWLVNSGADDESRFDREECRWRDTGRKLVFRALPFFLVGLLGAAFTPSSKDALVIYGVGGTIDWVRSDTTATKIPHKAVEALGRWLDETSNDGETDRR